MYIDALSAYEWLLCYLWVESKQKLERERASGKVHVYEVYMHILLYMIVYACRLLCSMVTFNCLLFFFKAEFFAKEDSMVYYSHSLALVFMEVSS